MLKNINFLKNDIDSVKDKCFEDCHYKFFHNFKYEYICDITLTNITKYEIFILTIGGKSMNLYDLNKN